MAVLGDRPGPGNPGGSGQDRRKKPPKNPKPTTPPEPGYEWVQQADGRWVQRSINPGGEESRPTTPPEAGYEWVQGTNGNWFQREISTTPTDQTGTPGTQPPTGSPGAAWKWDGSKWTRDSMPQDGKPYTWDDNLGWTEDTRLMSSRTNSKDYLVSLFKQFGFSDADVVTLTGLVDDWVQKGLADAGTEPVLMKFRETDIYKTRFAGMAELIGRGQAMSEAEYIQLESSFRNVMQNYGLKPEYYDTPADYARLIGAGLSPKEVEERVIAAKQAMNPLVAQELKQYYNIEDGDLTAYTLGLTDEKGLALASARNQEQIRTGARAAQIGAAAERAGFAMDKARAEGLGGTSVGQTIDPFQMGTLATLEGTFDQARREANRQSTLASIDNQAYSDQEALGAAFGDDKARLASEQRAKRERARFGGSSGVSGSSLGVARNL